MFPALLCTLLFSLSIVCGHRSAKLIGGTEANFWRLVVATVCLGAWSYRFGIGLAGDAFPLFFASGVIGIGIGDVALFQTLPRLGSRLSLLLINCLTAPLGAVVEWLWLGTSLSALQILGGIVVLVGVGLALSPGEHLKLSRSQMELGLLFSLISAIGGAGGAVLSRKAYAQVHASSLPLDGANAAFQRVVGGLLVAAFCLLVIKRRALNFHAHAQNSLPADATRKKWSLVWPWVLLNGVAGQTLGVSAMQRALETTPTGVVLAIIAATPIVVIPFTLLFEGERPTPRSLLGGFVAVAGVIVLVLAK